MPRESGYYWIRWKGAPSLPDSYYRTEVALWTRYGEPDDPERGWWVRCGSAQGMSEGDGFVIEVLAPVNVPYL